MILLPSTKTTGFGDAVTGLNIEEEHGGGCCGIVHLHNFPVVNSLGAGGDKLKDVTDTQRVEWIAKAIAEAVTNYTDDRDEPCGDPDCEICAPLRGTTDDDFDEVPECPNWHCVIEVVLAEYQRPEWEKALKGAGFKKVFDFLNSNSGNRCYVYYHETGEKK